MGWTMDGVKPSYGCNPEVIKYFRERRGLTQAALSREAGYSERLVNKAESGRSISKEAIADLAEALSSPDLVVHPEDLICDPASFARKYVDAFYIDQKDAMSRIQPFLDESVVLNMQGDPKEIPFAGKFHGHSGVAEMIERTFDVLTVPEGHDHRPHYHFLSSGNNVIIWGKTFIHPIGCPPEEPVVLSIRIQFHKSKVIQIDDRYDIKSIAEGIAKSRALKKHQLPDASSPG